MCKPKVPHHCSLSELLRDGSASESPVVLVRMLSAISNRIFNQNCLQKYKLLFSYDEMSKVSRSRVCSVARWYQGPGCFPLANIDFFIMDKWWLLEFQETQSPSTASSSPANTRARAHTHTHTHTHKEKRVLLLPLCLYIRKENLTQWSAVTLPANFIGKKWIMLILKPTVGKEEWCYRDWLRPVMIYS